MWLSQLVFSRGKNRKAQRDDIRSDSPCLDLDTFRLVISLAADLQWTLGKMDLRAGFFKHDDFGEQSIFTLPHRRTIQKRSGTFWQPPMVWLKLKL